MLYLREIIHIKVGIICGFLIIRKQKIEELNSHLMLCWVLLVFDGDKYLQIQLGKKAHFKLILQIHEGMM